MHRDTYISIIFAILIAALLGTFISIIIQQSYQVKKKYTKILVFLTTLLITLATIIYKYNLFISCVSKIFSYIVECIPFFYNSLMHVDSINPHSYIIKVVLIGTFFGVIAVFHCNYSAHIRVLFEESPKIYFIIIEIIYIVINTFLFILSYYILFDTPFYFVSFIIFILMIISAIKESTVFKLIHIAEYLGDQF